MQENKHPSLDTLRRDMMIADLCSTPSRISDSATVSFPNRQRAKVKEGAGKEKLVRSTQAPCHHPTTAHKDSIQESKKTMGYSGISENRSVCKDGRE
jgi:hypothetical protein